LNRLRILRFSSVIAVLLFAFASAIQISVIAKLEGKANGDWFGWHVANLGDINNDGFEDFAIGSAEGAGRVYIYFGSSTFDTVPDLLIKGDSVSNVLTGYSFETARDLNKDGYDDFMVQFFNGIKIWQVEVYLGSANPDTVPDYVLSDSIYGFGSFLGAGDMDSNGHTDIVVSTVAGSGWVHVYLQDTIFNSSNRFTYTDNQSLYGAYGMKVGDFNGDGYADMLTSSENVGPNGSSYIYFGRDTLVNSPDMVFPRKGYFAVGDINTDNVSDFGISYRLPAFYLGGTSLDTLPDVFIWTVAVGRINADTFGDIIFSDGDMFGVNGLVKVYLGGNPMDTFSD